MNFEAVFSRWGQLFSISPQLCEKEMMELMKVVCSDFSDATGELVAVPIKEFPDPLR